MFFDISSYSTDKYFDIVWRYYPSGNPQWTQNSLFLRPNLGCQFFFFFDNSGYLTDDYFDIVWGYHPLENGETVKPTSEKTKEKKCGAV